jgi:hypothetical protein
MRSEWRKREQALFDTGEYTHLPWRDEDWWIFSEAFLNHYAHVSTADDSKIAFTSDDSMGEQDRQTRMRPGKYLKSNFPALPDTEVQRYAAVFAKYCENLGFKLATTPEDIVRVYADGPSSCMKGAEQVSVYGAGDLAIAYLEKDFGEVTARSVVWPEKKIWVRIFGDAGRLEGALEREGYSCGDTGAFDGARILNIAADGGGFVSPYWDGCEGACVLDNEYLVLRRCGDMSMKTETGSIGGCCCCEKCGEGYDPENEGGCFGCASWCQDCLDDYTFCCEDCEETCPNDVMTVIDDCHYVCDDCLRVHYTCCHECGEYSSDREVTDIGDNHSVCESCLEEYSCCEACGDWGKDSFTEVKTQFGDVYWCEDCTEGDSIECDTCIERHDKKQAEQVEGLDYCTYCADEKREEIAEEESKQQAFFVFKVAGIYRPIWQAVPRFLLRKTRLKRLSAAHWW